eukprot:GHVS01022004.1.p1 GENE.GHVS01022004.1~~GHVS01022004.1.p1  ORF type:complete len:266 (-),score=65.13 GHVS01022004.1:687-1484(-)
MVSSHAGRGGAGEWEKCHRQSEDVSSLFTRCSTVELAETCSLDFDYEDEEKETTEGEPRRHDDRREGGKGEEGWEKIASWKDVEEEQSEHRRTLELVLVEYDSDGDVAVTESVVAASGLWQGESPELVGTSCAWRRCCDEPPSCLQTRQQPEGVMEGSENNQKNKTVSRQEEVMKFGVAKEEQERVVEKTKETLKTALATGGMKSVISPECLEVNRRNLKLQQIKQRRQLQELQMKQPVGIAIHSILEKSRVCPQCLLLDARIEP